MINPFVNGFRLVYYINSRNLCMCVCVRVFVTSKISGTGGDSATLLAPTWRASPGKLQQLLLGSTGCLVGEKKPLEPIRR